MSLSQADFGTQERADAAADALIAAYKTDFPEETAAYPDQKIQGFPELDTFWFAIHEGTLLQINIYFFAAMPPWLWNRTEFWRMIFGAIKTVQLLLHVLVSAKVSLLR